jgi:hypothetical protein
MSIQVLSMLVRAKQRASIPALTFEFYLHVLNCIVAKISICFYNYSLHSRPPVLGSSYDCLLHDKPTHCFVILSGSENHSDRTSIWKTHAC